MKRKIICLALTVLVCTTFLLTPVSAVEEVDGFDITYWYTDASSAGAWTSSVLPTFIYSNATSSSLSASNVETYLSSAFNAWDFTDVSHYVVDYQSSAKLIVHACTRSDATSFGLPANVIGATSYTKDFASTLFYSTSTYSYYAIRSSQIIIVDCDATSTSTGVKKVLAHELGHALGYFGHYANGNIMKEYYENVTSISPSANEEKHLGQFY